MRSKDCHIVRQQWRMWTIISGGRPPTLSHPVPLTLSPAACLLLLPQYPTFSRHWKQVKQRYNNENYVPHKSSHMMKWPNFVFKKSRWGWYCQFFVNQAFRLKMPIVQQCVSPMSRMCLGRIEAHAFGMYVH